MWPINPNKHEVEVSPKIVVFTFFFLLLALFIFWIKDILILLFLAFIIMVALRPNVDRLHHRLRIPRPLSIVIVYLLTISGLLLLVSLIIPPLVSEIYNVVKNLNLPIWQEKILSLKFNLSEITGLIGQMGNSASFVLSLITSTFNGVFTAFTLIVLSFYLMLDRPYLHKKVLWVTKKEKYVSGTEYFLNSLEMQLGGWIRGQVILMLIIGVISYTGLTLLRIPYALPLAILAGLLEILPNLGPTVAAVPAIVIAFMALGPWMALATTFFYILVQQLENNLIVPKIMQKNADVNPLIAIVVILIGLKLGGVVGALLAVPIYITFRCSYRLYLDLKTKN